MSFGANGVDRVHSLRKIQTRLCGTNFFIICTEFHAVTKWSQMHPNTMKRTKRPYGVNRVDLLQKILTQLCGLNFCINYKSLDRFEPSIVKQQNRPKCPQTLRNKTKQNMSLGSNGVNRVHSLRQIRTRLRGTNFCINCTIWAHFAPSFMQ